MNIHDIYRPFLLHFRKRRNELFMRRMNLTADTTVLDVGGTPWFWDQMPIKPKVTLLNLTKVKDDRYTQVVGNACALPFPDKSFDIVFSNSMIEHLGTWENQVLAAKEMERVGQRLWIQTPYQWFPVEPHYVTPVIHWFPKKARRKLAPYTVWGMVEHLTPQQCDAIVEEIRLLDIRQMRTLFPPPDKNCVRAIGRSCEVVDCGARVAIV